MHESYPLSQMLQCTDTTSKEQEPVADSRAATMVRRSARMTELIADAENYGPSDKTATSMTPNGLLPSASLRPWSRSCHLIGTRARSSSNQSRTTRISGVIESVLS